MHWKPAYLFDRLNRDFTEYAKFYRRWGVVYSPIISPLILEINSDFTLDRNFALYLSIMALKYSGSIWV